MFQFVPHFSSPVLSFPLSILFFFSIGRAQCVHNKKRNTAIEYRKRCKSYCLSNHIITGPLSFSPRRIFAPPVSFARGSERAKKKSREKFKKMFSELNVARGKRLRRSHAILEQYTDRFAMENRINSRCRRRRSDETEVFDTNSEKKKESPNGKATYGDKAWDIRLHRHVGNHPEITWQESEKKSRNVKTVCDTTTKISEKRSPLHAHMLCVTLYFFFSRRQLFRADRRQAFKRHLNISFT